MCEGGSKACTVCKTGYYLTEKGECSTCEDFFVRDMVSSRLFHFNRWSVLTVLVLKHVETVRITIWSNVMMETTEMEMAALLIV